MTDARKVWMPDTFFRNEKEGRFHNILVPNVYIRIFPTGYVLYSIRWAAENKRREEKWNKKFWEYFQGLHSSLEIFLWEFFIWNSLHFRVSLTLACPMNLKLYPLDRQKCSLRVASCKYIFKIFSSCRSRSGSGSGAMISLSPSLPSPGHLDPTHQNYSQTLLFSKRLIPRKTHLSSIYNKILENTSCSSKSNLSNSPDKNLVYLVQIAKKSSG